MGWLEHVDWASVRDWFAAAAAIITALAALPAVYFFMLDRWEARSRLISAEPRGESRREGANSLEVICQGISPTDEVEAVLKVVRGDALLRMPDTYENHVDPSRAKLIKAAPPAGKRQTIRLRQDIRAPHGTRSGFVDVFPGSTGSNVMCRVVSRINGQSISSRKIAISKRI